MHCSEALNGSASRVSGVDTVHGRVLITERAPEIILSLVPRLADSGVLNEAGTIVHRERFRDVAAAVSVAISEYGVDELSWLPSEELASLPSTVHSPGVEGHRLMSAHEDNKGK